MKFAFQKPTFRDQVPVAIVRFELTVLGAFVHGRDSLQLSVVIVSLIEAGKDAILAVRFGLYLAIAVIAAGDAIRLTIRVRDFLFQGTPRVVFFDESVRLAFHKETFAL